MKGDTKKLLRAMLVLAAVCGLLAAAPFAAYAATTAGELDLKDPPSTGGRYVVDDSNHVITVNGADPIRIIGNGINGGQGWSVYITEAKAVELGAGAVIHGASGSHHAISLSADAVL